MSSCVIKEEGLYLPENDVNNPVVSIIIPSLNEEITIATFIDWCHQGLVKAGVVGEILIIDSSSDNTPDIALSKGARVLKTPKRGLGHAYIDALPYIRGKYVIMGDCDCTYDFRDIKPFIDKLDEGYEYVMGTRIKGYIEDNAMPPLHRYFGTPLTTWILNVIYGSNYSDIHCGMRAMTRDVLMKIDLESTAWEYASEMVLKASKFGLRITEVPIHFYKDPPGRESVHRRMGWFSPWQAGWMNLKVMFMYSPSFFLKIPGIITMVIGLILVLGLLHGDVKIGNLGFSIHWMILGAMLAVSGFSSYMLSILSEMIYEFKPEKLEGYKRLFTYNNGVVTGSLMVLVGFIILVDFLVNYIQQGAVLFTISRLAILGLTIFVLGFELFTFTLIFQMIVNKNKSERTKKAMMSNVK